MSFRPLIFVVISMVTALGGSNVRAQDKQPIVQLRRIEVGRLILGRLSNDDPRLVGFGPSQGFELFVPESGPVTITVESYEFDAALQVQDKNGTLLAQDDDSGVETNARLVLAANAGGNYRIVAASKESTGEFTLSVHKGETSQSSTVKSVDLAISYRNTAAKRALARGDMKAATGHQLEEGKRLYAHSRFPEAKTAFESALHSSLELGDCEEKASALGNLGNVYLSLGDYTRAREFLEEQLALSRKLGDRLGAARSLANLGTVHQSLGDYSRARAYDEECLTLARELHDRVAAARVLGNLGNVYLSLGDYARAREHHEECLVLVRELGDRAGEEAALGSVGNVYLSLGDYTRAREYYEQWLALARELGDRAGEAMALGSLGIIYKSLGDFTRACEFYEECLDLARELGDRATEANTLGNLGNAFWFLGNYTRAREFLEQQLALTHTLGDRAGEARALGNLGSVCHSLGNYTGARKYFEQDLALMRVLGNHAGEAMALGKLGNVYKSLGDYARALEYLEQYLAIVRKLGDRAGEARALGSLVVVHGSVGDYSRARELVESQLTLARELGDRPEEALALGNLGSLYCFLGDYTPARECHEQCLALARDLGDRAEEATALGNLGNDYFRLGEYAMARQLGETAQNLAQELGDKETAVYALMIRARSSAKLHDISGGGVALDEAECLIDEIPAAGLEDVERMGFRGQFDVLAAIAQDLTALRLKKAEDNQASRQIALTVGFSAAGRWKSRSLLEGIAEHRAGRRSTEAIRLRHGRREALASYAVVLQRVSRAIHDGKSPDEIEELRGEARAKLEEAEECGAHLREVSPADAALDLPLGADPGEVQHAVLGPKALLVEYAEGEDRLYAYVVGKGVLEFLDLGERIEIATDVKEYLSLIRGTGSPFGLDAIHGTGELLFDRLLAPALAKSTEPIEHLVIVPSPSLASLPFESLVVESASTSSRQSFSDFVFVLDRFEVVYGPSSPVLVELNSIGPRKKEGRVLLLADPWYTSESQGEPIEAASRRDVDGVRWLPNPGAVNRLPKSRDEVMAIARVLKMEGEESDLAGLTAKRHGSFEGGRFALHLGTAASRSRLAGALRDYSVIHLACHGFVDREFPQRTGLALASGEGDEGFFTIADALELDLDANLVVLSACDTAQGEVRAGEGLQSLARAFLYAGARSVIASHWELNDWAAAWTMETFYRKCFAERIPPARALREARLELRRLTYHDAAQIQGKSRQLGDRLSPLSPPRQLGNESPYAHPRYWAGLSFIGLPE